MILMNLKSMDELTRENIKLRRELDRVGGEREYYREMATHFRIILHVSTFFFLAVFIGFMILTRE